MGLCCFTTRNSTENNNKHTETQKLNQSSPQKCIEGSDTYPTTPNKKINIKEFNEYKKYMQQIFYNFAGIHHYSKKRSLYIKPQDLQKFLDIVCITTPVSTMFKQIDTDINDDQITLNEWMEYFCDININPDCYEIYFHITKQITWKLLIKALKMFEILDKNKNQRINWGSYIYIFNVSKKNIY